MSYVSGQYKASSNKRRKLSTYTNGHGATLAGFLDGNGVRLTEVGTPVTTANGHNGELGNDDGGTDGGSDFLGGLNAKTDVSLAVANNHNGFEAGTLTGTGLLLDGLDLLYALESANSSRPLEIWRIVCERTFITSSLSLGKKKSTIWYSLMGRECR